MAVFNTDAIVLKQFDLGEADKIITFFTRENGKVRAVAKGVRKTKSSLSGLVLPFSYSNITVYQGRSLGNINQISNKFSFAALREDLTKMAYASYMAELVEKVGMENDPNVELFSLLLTSFHRLLSAEKGYSYINLVFKLGTLSIIGLQPETGLCTGCGEEQKTSVSNYFDISAGGIICQKCIKPVENSYSQISGETLEIMKILLASGIEMPKNLKVSDQALAELDELIDQFITYHLDIKIKSLQFLHMIRDLG